MLEQRYNEFIQPFILYYRQSLLHFALYCLRKCYNKNLHTNILLFKFMLTCCCKEHSKNLTSLTQQEFVSSWHHCLVQVRLLPWVCLQSWFRGSILWVYYLRLFHFQQSTWEKAWRPKKGLWQRLDVVWDTSAPDFTGYNPIRGPKLTAREAGKCSLLVCPNWNWVNI